MLLEVIGLPAMLEQFGEELGEIIQASYKLIRKKKGENLTPKTIEQVMDNFSEEIADIMICSMEILKIDDYEEFKKEFALEHDILNYDTYDEYNCLMSIIYEACDMINVVGSISFMIRTLYKDHVNDIESCYTAIRNDGMEYNRIYGHIRTLTNLLYIAIDIYGIDYKIDDYMLYKRNRMASRLKEYNESGTCSE